jgi:hypothetical protein
MEEKEATQAERVRFRRLIATATAIWKIERAYREAGRIADAEKTREHKERILREAGK